MVPVRTNSKTAVSPSSTSSLTALTETNGSSSVMVPVALSVPWPSCSSAFMGEIQFQSEGLLLLHQRRRPAEGIDMVEVVARGGMVRIATVPV